MRAFSTVFIVLAITVNSGGCLARQLAADGRNFRQALLDMYSDQVIDNLIRAAENRPFVQLSYRSLTVTDTQILKANVGGEIDPTQNKTFVQATLAVLTRMHSVTSKLLYGGSLEGDRQMQLFADPVLAKQDVYTYYLAFAHDPTLFVCSDAPPPCPVHIKKQCGKKWYWVPEEAAGVFLQLALRTTFMRGADTPPPLLWGTTITGIVVTDTLPNECNPESVNAVVTIAKSVPNRDGWLYIDTADGQRYELPIIHWPRPADPDDMVLSLKTEVSAETAKLFDQFKSRPAQYYNTEKENQGELPIDRQRLEAAVKAYNEYFTNVQPVVLTP